MTLLKYDNVIKKSRDLDYHFRDFSKILCSATLMQNFIARAQLVQDLWRGALLLPLIRDIKNLFEHEEEDYHKPVRVSNFWSNNYIEYESNSDKNKHYQLRNFLIELDRT